MGETSIGEAIQEFISRSPLKSGLRSIQIEELWREKMGNTISRYTDKIQLIHSTLFITTSVAPLKNELHYQRDKII